MPKSKIIMDDILRECVERAYQDTHLGRDDQTQDRERVFAQLLSGLEISGDAMRYVERGRIAWKATPQLRDEIQDLLIDAIAEQKEEAV